MEDDQNSPKPNYKGVWIEILPCTQREMSGDDAFRRMSEDYRFCGEGTPSVGMTRRFPLHVDESPF